MTEDKKKTEERLSEIEKIMALPDFWQDKATAQAIIKEYEELKTALSGAGKYDKGDAVITIFSGAGGTDAEDFSRILLDMYLKFVENHDWKSYIIHKNENDHGGYRNITFEVLGKEAYGVLKNESGVHRLVRLSPFNAKSQRHTSFSMVEVIPKFGKTAQIEEIPESELRVELSRSSGPGGQNVNKRETSVRIVHLPTNLSASADSERSQPQNKEKALAILKGKLYHLRESERKKREQGLYVSKTTEIEWGNQIRSYVFHPYKMIKDHTTGFDERNMATKLDYKRVNFGTSKVAKGLQKYEETIFHI